MKKLITLLLLLCFLISPVPAWYIKPMLGRQINWSDPLSKGLVGYWLMNEGTGSTILDLSGNGNDLSISGTVNWVAGSFGPCLDFLGEDDFLYSSHIDLTAGFTVISRVKFNNVTGDRGIVEVYDDGLEFQFWMDFPSHFAIAVYEGGWGVAYGTTVPVADTWYTVAMTYVPDNAKLYVNGLYDGANVTGRTISNSSSQFRVGGPTKDHEGRMDYVYLFNRALSASEIALLYREPHRLIARRPIGLTYIPVVTPSGQLIIINRN